MFSIFELWLLLCSRRLCTSLPWTTSRPSAVRLILVPGLLAAHTYTPECCRETSEIMRFPVPRTWIPSTPMERPSEGEHQNINQNMPHQVILHQTSPSPQLRWWWFLPSLLQDTMGLGFPVAMHSRMAVWWTLMVRFWGPDRMTGSL